MSVFITKPISGIIVEGQEFDLRPKEALSGTYEAPTEMNFEIKVENPPDDHNKKVVDLKGKPISGRMWIEPDSKTSTKGSHHKPDQSEENYRRAKTMQLRDFNKQRKKEIADKVDRDHMRYLVPKSKGNRRRN